MLNKCQGIYQTSKRNIVPRALYQIYVPAKSLDVWQYLLIYLYLYHTLMKYCDLIGPLQGGLFLLYTCKTWKLHSHSTYTTCDFHDVIKMVSTTQCRTINHNVGIVTTCLLKLLYKHHVTCTSSHTKSMLDCDRKVAKWRSDHKRYHSNDALSWDIRSTAVLQCFLFLYASRTLLWYFVVTERHTEREV